MNSASDLVESGYIIRPNFKQKYYDFNLRFRSAIVQQLIHKILIHTLQSVSYDSESCSIISKKLADDIKNELKTLDFPRYKFVINVVIGEMKGEGVK